MRNIIDLSNLPNILRVGETAAHAAGIYLRQRLGQAQVTHQKAAHDDLLDADLEAERIILTQLHQKTPELGILSEETHPETQHDSHWIVDPLDGSANFQHGNPLFAVAIALVLNRITVGSIIYLPVYNEMFTATLGQGAFLNKKRIQVSSISILNKAIAHIGDSIKGNDHQATRERINDTLVLTASVYRVRMIGTAATDLTYLACGRADLLVNHATSPWDVEAGKLILLEAGGKTTTKRIGNRTINIYSNSSIHEEADRLIAPESSQPIV